MNLITLLLDRLAAALTAPFAMAQLLIVLALVGLYGLVVIPLALASGLLRTPWRRLTPQAWLPLALRLMVMPALLEESIFRILLLPSPQLDLDLTGRVAWAALSVGLFVMYHPLAGRFWYPEGRELFAEARFLVPCTLLAVACVVAFEITGSLWAPVLIHWLTVLIWLGPCDGARDLTDRRSAQRTAH